MSPSKRGCSPQSAKEDFIFFNSASIWHASWSATKFHSYKHFLFSFFLPFFFFFNIYCLRTASGTGQIWTLGTRSSNDHRRHVNVPGMVVMTTWVMQKKRKKNQELHHWRPATGKMLQVTELSISSISKFWFHTRLSINLPRSPMEILKLYQVTSNRAVQHFKTFL